MGEPGASRRWCPRSIARDGRVVVTDLANNSTHHRSFVRMRFARWVDAVGPRGRLSGDFDFRAF